MKNSVLYIIFTEFILLLSGCCREEPLDTPSDLCRIRLAVDWLPSGIELDGMTAVFYPVDGGQRSQFLCSQITGKEIGVKAGLYNVVVFNQAEGDFSYFTIEGQERFEDIRVVMKERAIDWYEPADDERVAHEPEPFAVAIKERFEVTEEMVNASRIEGKVFSFACQPKAVTFATKLAVHIKGLQNIKAARGTIQNMADTYWIAQGKTGTGGITHGFIISNRTFDDSSSTDGILSGSFYSFGSPEKMTRSTTANLLTLSILLVDNKTVIKKTYDVSTQIASIHHGDEEDGEESGNDEIIVGKGTSSDPGSPDDQPLELPDVEPEEEGDKGGGFDASVDDWGEKEEIDIPI